MSDFSKYHPIVNLAFFVSVISINMTFMHPISLSISLICSLLTNFSELKNKPKNFGYILITFLLMAVINPLFSHEGNTILLYFKNGNPLTLESILYGIASAAMIASIILWFKSFSKIMTSDKISYLLAKILPSIALIFTMIISFVPRLKEQFQKVKEAQQYLSKDANSKNILKKIKHALLIISIVSTWIMENSIDTADSMKSRAYGVKKRTFYSIYKFSENDKKALIYIFALIIIIIFELVKKSYKFSYFPILYASKIAVLPFLAQFLLQITAVLIKFLEVRKWKYLESKI